ncbi:uncharacterized protein IUM83_14866 [Phytophthora cinnamomi]|uniref:uncharacterized protein n=1 Tax=Phytophthora cinnamomi TaxID=4785 RepID=UPI003559F1F8|nr:hypothetical protein IUM83_14866 [Phytophthora cinnamomi]
MLSRWVLAIAIASLAVMTAAEPFQNSPADSNTEERSDSIFTTLSDDGPMAGTGTGTRQLEPLPTVSAKELASASIYTTLSSDGPMGGTGQRKLRQY